MSSGFTPVNQVRLTNVAYVRLQKKGKRFEIACYRNKVVSWRNKIETNLQEVLQVNTVFTNVSKGMLASSGDLIDAFGTADQKLVCQEILDKGEMQVSEQERGALLDSIFRDVASIVVDKSINPESKRPYTISMIQNAMRQIHFSASLTKSSKSQALEVIRKLKAVMPIARASMYLRIICPYSAVEDIKSRVLRELDLTLISEITVQGVSTLTGSDEVHLSETTQTTKAMVQLELCCDPEHYRRVEDGVATLTGGQGRVEVMQMRVQAPLQVAGTGTPQQGVGTVIGANVGTLHAVSTASAAAVKPTAKVPAAPSSSSTESAQSSICQAPDSTHISDDDHDIDSLDDDREVVNDVDNDDEATHAIETLLLARRGGGGLKERVQRAETEDQLEAIGIASKKAKAKAKKSKNEIKHDESDEYDDNMNNSTINILTSESTHSGNFKEKEKSQKKGKTARRVEKQEAQELEQRAAKLKSRLLERNKDRVKESATGSTMDSDSTLAKDKSAGAVAESPIPIQKLPTTTATTPPTSSAVVPSEALVLPVENSTAKSCNTCGGSFPDAATYRNHFKSDWHRYNLNRKLKNQQIVASEEDFAKLTLKEIDANII